MSCSASGPLLLLSGLFRPDTLSAHLWTSVDSGAENEGVAAYQDEGFLERGSQPSEVIR